MISHVSRSGEMRVGRAIERERERERGERGTESSVALAFLVVAGPRETSRDMSRHVERSINRSIDWQFGSKLIAVVV